MLYGPYGELVLLVDVLDVVPVLSELGV